MALHRTRAHGVIGPIALVHGPIGEGLVKVSEDSSQVAMAPLKALQQHPTPEDIDVVSVLLRQLPGLGESRQRHEGILDGALCSEAVELIRIRQALLFVQRVAVSVVANGGLAILFGHSGGLPPTPRTVVNGGQNSAVAARCHPWPPRIPDVRADGPRRT